MQVVKGGVMARGHHFQPDLVLLLMILAMIMMSVVLVLVTGAVKSGHKAGVVLLVHLTG